MKKGWVVMFFLFITTLLLNESSYGKMLNGFEGGEIHVLFGSLNGLNCDISLNVENINHDTFSVTIDDDAVSDHFLGSSTSHNRSAIYRLTSESESIIYINDKLYESDSALLSGLAGKTFAIKGRKTFVWRPNTGKIAAGFPRAYYRTVYTNTKFVTFDDNGEMEIQEKTDIKNENNPATIKGQVEHSNIWEKRRIEKNRNKKYFWPGEGFMLNAKVNGSKKPERVEAKVVETNFKKNLTYNGDTWGGWLYDDKMLEEWMGKSKYKIYFVFTAYFTDESCQDIEEIVIDNNDNYWLLHRKE